MNATTAVAPPPTPNPEDKARYDAARKELVQALQKKRLVDRQLAQLEVQIYNFEGSYLSETAQHSGGNIIQGFDGYLKTQSVGRRRHEPTDADRVFSNSSLTYQKSLDILAEASDDPDAFGPSSLSLHPNGLTLTNHHNTFTSHSHSHGHSSNSTTSRNPTPGPGLGLTSIVLPPPTQKTQQELTAAQQKKMRDKEYQRRKRATAAREKERNAQLAAAAEAARIEAVRVQAVAAATAAGIGTGVGRGSSMGLGEDGGEGEGGMESVSAAVSTARGRVTKKPRQADDD